MNYGIPYKGSKNKIMKFLLQNLPHGETFVELFCGGCSVTHAMMLHGRYKHYIINDIEPIMPKTFIKAIYGAYRDEKRWISHEDFFRLRETDEYASICFSFGTSTRSYAYSKTIEPYKRACHYAIVFDQWADMRRLCPEVADTAYVALRNITDIHRRYLKFRQSIVRRLNEIGGALPNENPLYNSGRIELERLESLERLERLQRLERLESLEKPSIVSFSMDYQDVPIPTGAVVYCDPPYKGTEGYGIRKNQKFDHERFYSWCLSRDFPVFVSEYQMPDGFGEIATTTRQDCFNAFRSAKRIERLFVQKKFLNMFRQPAIF